MTFKSRCFVCQGLDISSSSYGHSDYVEQKDGDFSEVAFYASNVYNAAHRKGGGGNNFKLTILLKMYSLKETYRFPSLDGFFLREYVWSGLTRTCVSKDL